jgi:hypothetical protein
VTIEEPLAGGFGNLGAVVRIGTTIRRPRRQSTEAVRALLVHLEEVGFDRAPRYLGTDEQDREILTFVDGASPLPPYPAWAMTDDALVALAHLLRDFHAATATFDARAVSGWELDWADPGGGPVVCHNDGFPENVVFRDGLPVALIDFDMAAPGRPFWDLAIAAQEWLPLHAPASRVDHMMDLDAVERFARFARAYGVRADEAELLVDVVFEERAQSIANIRREVAAGDPTWIEQWHAGGGEARAELDSPWLDEQRTALVAAVRDLP